jgi:membrane-associated protein
MASRILELVATVGGPLLALVAAALGFAESAVGLDLLVPGELGMAVAGAAAGHNGTAPALVLAAAIVGAIAGDSAGYWVGRRYGTDVVCHWRFTRRHLAPGLARAQRYFERRGAAAVFAGRWVGALRAVLPVVAGAARMPYARFLLWGVPAIVSWTTAVVLGGYYLGGRAAEFIDEYGRWISVVAVAALAAYLLVRRHRRRNGGHRGEPDGCGPARGHDREPERRSSPSTGGR